MDKKGDERCRHAVKRLSKSFSLVEKLDAPVVLTVAAKGVVPEEHPLCIGANLPFEPVQSLIKTADVVLVVGTELAETDLDPFKASIDVDETLIRVDLDPEQLVKNQRPDVGIWSDSKLALSEILKALGGGKMLTEIKRREPEGWLRFDRRLESSGGRDPKGITSCWMR